jgi:NAD(P)-dependent dehydrogenase (short-subunit alcohol dehydrogenase family)
VSTHDDVDLDFSLDGRVALVTGGGSGIGAAIASAFARKGARIAIADLAEDAAAAGAAALGEPAAAFGCDVADPASVAAAVQQVQGRPVRRAVGGGRGRRLPRVRRGRDDQRCGSAGGRRVHRPLNGVGEASPLRRVRNTATMAAVKAGSSPGSAGVDLGSRSVRDPPRAGDERRPRT